jgi:outer membrane protein assembly factor BamB
MHAFDAATGAVVWKRDFAADFKAEIRACGYSNSPLAYKDTILLPAGGPGYAFVALDQRDGRVRWHALDFQNAYASPILIDVDGRPEAIFVTAADIVGVDPDTGAQRWRHPHPTSQGVNVSSPVWGPDHLLFVSSAYDTGSRVLKLTRTAEGTAAKEVWFHSRLRIHFGNAVRIGGRVYGSSGDAGVAPLSAVDVATGSVAWRDRKVGRGSLLVAGGRFIILDEDGALLLATPGDEGLTIHSKAQVLSKSAWTVPTLVGTTLYVRDRQQVIALDLGS